MESNLRLQRYSFMHKSQMKRLESLRYKEAVVVDGVAAATTEPDDDDALLTSHSTWSDLCNLLLSSRSLWML